MGLQLPEWYGHPSGARPPDKTKISCHAWSALDRRTNAKPSHKEARAHSLSGGSSPSARGTGPCGTGAARQGAAHAATTGSRLHSRNDQLDHRSCGTQASPRGSATCSTAASHPTVRDHHPARAAPDDDRIGPSAPGADETCTGNRTNHASANGYTDPLPIAAHSSHNAAACASGNT